MDAVDKRPSQQFLHFMEDISHQICWLKTASKVHYFYQEWIQWFGLVGDKCVQFMIVSTNTWILLKKIFFIIYYSYKQMVMFSMKVKKTLYLKISSYEIIQQFDATEVKYFSYKITRKTIW